MRVEPGEFEDFTRVYIPFSANPLRALSRCASCYCVCADVTAELKKMVGVRDDGKKALLKEQGHRFSAVSAATCYTTSGVRARLVTTIIIFNSA